MSDGDNLPRGWVWTTLGATCEINPRRFTRTPADDALISKVPMAAVEAGSGRMDGSELVLYGDVKSKSLTPFEEDDVLFAKVTPCMENGKVAVARGLENGRAVGSTEFFVLRQRGGIDPRYLAYFLLQDSVRNRAARAMTGAVGLRRVPRGYLEELDIPLPPLVEQQRIAEALEDHISRLDVAEKSLGVTLRRLDRLRESMTAPTNRIAVTHPDEAASFPSPAGVDDGELPLIPSSWRWMRLGELADVVGGVTKDAKKQGDPDYVDVPYLRVANVQRGRIDLTTVAHIRVPKAKAAHLFLRPGDVLLNEGGDRDKLGRGWIWEDQIPEMVHQNHVFRARIKDQLLDPRLLAWHANGFGRSWFEANGKQSVNLASISLSKIKMFPVPIPPKAEQAAMVQEIEGHLSLFDNAADLGRVAMGRATALRRALLSHAFAGKLVPQELTDEPAWELLARIETERASGATGRRTPLARSAVKASPRAALGVPAGFQEELPL